VNAFTYVPGAPPVIQSLVAKGTRAQEPAQFADLNESVNVTATVTDADSTAASLQYTWSADLGTISGTGAKVTWQAPASAATPIKATITLSVSDGASAVTGTTAVSLHDSTKEIGDIATLFLVNFSKTEVPVDTVIKDFTTECPGTAGERQDVINNRAGFVDHVMERAAAAGHRRLRRGLSDPPRLAPGRWLSYSQVRWNSNKARRRYRQRRGRRSIAAVFVDAVACSSDLTDTISMGRGFWGGEGEIGKRIGIGKHKTIEGLPHPKRRGARQAVVESR
jgi:hypothetical protein